MSARYIGASRRASAGKQSQQAGVVWRINGQFRYGREAVRFDMRSEFFIRAFCAEQQLRVFGLRRRVGSQPIVGVVPVDEVLHIGFRPFGQYAT